MKIKFQEYFRNIPSEQRVLIISNPTEIGWVRRRPRANPSLPQAPGASLGQTMAPSSPTSNSEKNPPQASEEAQPVIETIRSTPDVASPSGETCILDSPPAPHREYYL